MARTVLKSGVEIDIPTRGEVREDIHTAWRDHESQRERERARGIKKFRRSALLSTPAGTRVSILDAITPEAGYSWVIRCISVYLASAGTGQAFITSDTSTTLSSITQSKPVAVFTTSAQYQVEFLNAGACILDVDEGLYLNFTQNVNGYMVAGWMAPTEMIYKLY